MKIFGQRANLLIGEPNGILKLDIGPDWEQMKEMNCLFAVPLKEVPNPGTHRILGPPVDSAWSGDKR